MNRMKGKKILAALGFFSIAGVAGGCSQPAPEIRYQIETDQPCQTMAYFQCFRCLEYAIHRALAAGETKPNSRLAVQHGE